MVRKLPKCKLAFSQNRMNMTQWNEFEPRYVHNLEKDFQFIYVDVPETAEKFLQNNHDTLVGMIRFNDAADAINFLTCETVKRADEVHLLQKTSKTFIFRLWWD